MPQSSWILLFVLSTSAAAQDLTSFEKILFPALARAPVRGNQNTAFQTHLEATAAQPVPFYPAHDTRGFGMQPQGVNLVRFHEIVPRTGGRLLYFDRALADRIRFFYALTVTGPDGAPHRTTLPVIRERDFRRGPTQILGLVTSPIVDFSNDALPTHGYRTRNHIRIYDVDHLATLSAVVRVTVEPLYAYGSWATFDVRLDSRPADDPSYPYYAEIALPDLCIRAPSGNRCRVYGLTVTIEPDDPNARYVAIASATDNVTGETAVFWAQ